MEKPDLNRRKFLKQVGATVGAAALGGMPGVAKGAAENLAKSVSFDGGEESTESAESLEEVIAHYEQTGEVLNPKILFETMRQSESLQYYLGQNELSPEQIEGLTEAAKNDILTIFESLDEAHTDPFLQLRQAVEMYLDGNGVDTIDETRAFFESEKLQQPMHEKAVYNSTAVSINDVLDSRALQCRSGTHMFNQMATEILPEEELDKLVIIYTDGHVLPGYESGENEYTGLEMTANVEEAPVFRSGSAEALGSFRVVRALPATLENLTAGGTIRPDDVILLEEADPASQSEMEAPDAVATHEIFPGEQGVRPEKYGFGKSEFSEIDKERPDLKRIDYKKAPPPGYGAARLGISSN